MQIKFILNIDATTEVTSIVPDKVDTVFSNEAWLQLIRTITKKSVYAIGDRVFPLLVMRFQNDQIYLNRGEGAGIEVGDLREVFSTGEDLVDPSTGKSLGTTEYLLGKIRIIRVSPKFSVAVPVSVLLDKPKAGDTVR